MDYRFRLSPQNSWVANLCDSQSYDYVISDESDSEVGATDVHIFSSVHLDSTSDLATLRCKLKGMLMLISGALRVIHGFEIYDKVFGDLSISASENVNFQDLIKFKELDVTQINPFDFHNPQIKHPRADPLSFLVNLSSKDEDVMTILGMCSLGVDWVNLYRVYETVCEFTNIMVENNTMPYHWENNLNKKPKKKYNKDEIAAIVFDIEYQRIKDFKGTANSFKLLGYLGRHGKGNNNNMTNPMSRSNASLLVNEITKKFLQDKLTKANHSTYQI